MRRSLRRVSRRKSRKKRIWRLSAWSSPRREWRSTPQAPVRSTPRATPANWPTAILHAIGDSDLRRAVGYAPSFDAPAATWSQPFWGLMSPIPLSLLETVEALPFATRDAEGSISRAGQARHRRLDVQCRGRTLSTVAQKLPPTGSLAAFVRQERTGRWRHMADLLHLLEHPALRNAFFPLDEEAPPVEPARARFRADFRDRRTA